MPEQAVWAAVGALGLIVGSFLNVCIHRLPLRQSVVHPRSRCAACAAPIAWYDNIPLLSYLLLRGRCRGCRARISWVYPAVEAVNAGAYLALYARWGAAPALAVLAAFVSALIALVMIDARHQILPDRITLPMLGLGLATSGINPEVTWSGSIAGAVLGAAAPAALLLLWQWCFGIEGMGWGDVKMLAMIGSFLGPGRAAVTLLAGACLGAAVGVGMMAARRGTLRTALPFGVFLGLAAAGALGWGAPVVGWYAQRLAAAGWPPW